MLERDGLLDTRVDLEILAVQVGQAFAVPLQPFACVGGEGGQQAAAQQQGRGDALHVVIPGLIVFVGGFFGAQAPRATHSGGSTA
ncbi:hypothetical protein D3C72_2081820 [compost metagenome]